jgi:DNA-binding transcriptional ArsR family regulator
MSDQDFILAPATVMANFALMPVKNVITSMEMLTMAETHSGVGDWIEQTYARLSPQQRRQHLVVLKMLHPITLDDYRLPDFPAFIEQRVSTDPHEWQERLVQMFAKKLEMEPAAILNSRDGFINRVEEKFAPHYAEKEIDFDLEFYGDFYDLLSDPTNINQTVGDHLWFMWNNFLEAECRRNLPMLKESINAFQSIDYSGQTALEVIRVVTGRDLTNFCCDELEAATQVHFIPSMHIGPYVTYELLNGDVYLTFGARMPQGAKVASSTALPRAELLVRLSALADDTRLTILELLSRHQELCSQDIMNTLELSQSSTSRHLRQLTATGYLVERRREVAKCYMLNEDRIDDTMRALKQFLHAGE